MGKIAFVAFPFVLSGLIPLMILTQYPAILIRRRYLGQNIVATLQGLTFRRKDFEQFVPWDEINSYYLEKLPGHFSPALFVVETSFGRFEWVQGIYKGKVLRTLVEEFCMQADVQTWRYFSGADEDVLGGATSLWQSGIVGKGPKRHHYRTRMVRVLVVLGGFFLLALPVPVAVGQFSDGHIPGAGDYITLALMWGTLLPSVVGGAITFFRSSLQVDEAGLLQIGVWRKRFLAWNEIDKFSYNGFWYIVKGRETSIRFAPLVADAPGLCEEIEARSGIKLVSPADERVN